MQTHTHFIGVESKRFEPFRDRKIVSLSEAYDRPVWGAHMQPFERLRDQLRSGETIFLYLDAAQLVKHAFGLVTDARRENLKPHLHYLFAEPTALKAKQIPAEAHVAHRDEIARFAAMVEGAEVTFCACSYREWLSPWAAAGPEVAGHASSIIERFAP